MNNKSPRLYDDLPYEKKTLKAGLSFIYIVFFILSCLALSKPFLTCNNEFYLSGTMLVAPFFLGYYLYARTLDKRYKRIIAGFLILLNLLPGLQAVIAYFYTEVKEDINGFCYLQNIEKVKIFGTNTNITLFRSAAMWFVIWIALNFLFNYCVNYSKSRN